MFVRHFFHFTKPQVIVQAESLLANRHFRALPPWHGVEEVVFGSRLSYLRLPHFLFLVAERILACVLPVYIPPVMKVLGENGPKLH